MQSTKEGIVVLKISCRSDIQGNPLELDSSEVIMNSQA